MKATIEISDPLLEAARQIATREKTTVKALVEEGLLKIIAERKQDHGFKLRRASFKGNGLQPQLAGASWERIRALVYDGHGA